MVAPSLPATNKLWAVPRRFERLSKITVVVMYNHHVPPKVLLALDKMSHPYLGR
jgi:hypothetical protein